MLQHHRDMSRAPFQTNLFLAAATIQTDGPACGVEPEQQLHQGAFCRPLAPTMATFSRRDAQVEVIQHRLIVAGNRSGRGRQCQRIAPLERVDTAWVLRLVFRASSLVDPRQRPPAA